MFKFLKGAILFAPFFLFLPFSSQAYTTHLFCECVYTYPEDPAGPLELCPADADVTQIITASMNRFSGKLLVRYDGYFEGYGNSVFSDLHFCSLTPGEQQFW